MTDVDADVRMVDVDVWVLDPSVETAQNRFPDGQGFFLKWSFEILAEKMYLDGESREGGGLYVRRN